jgi:HD superfamily phosphodiesterase
MKKKANQNRGIVNNILSDARKFLVEFFQGKKHRFETRHPWRKEWEFAVLHSLRVEMYSLKILEHEPHNLSETEIGLLRLSAILHDIGRLEITDDHAKLGAQIADDWLIKRPDNELAEDQKNRVVRMIAEHST